jgi:hypothetical protein
MPKMTVTTNDGRFVADFEIGDVDPVDYQPEIDEVLRSVQVGGPRSDCLQRDDVGPGSPRPQECGVPQAWLDMLVHFRPGRAEWSSSPTTAMQSR